MKKKLSAIIVGAGHRSLQYASYAKTHPDQLEIIGVADPNPLRRESTAKAYGFGMEMCFQSAEDLALKPKLADFIINGTMDQQHVPTSIPLLERGYDILLEKPFATNESEMFQLVEAARRYNRVISVCHVLRYTPFYKAIRTLVSQGEIGDLLSIQAVEHVSYHHVAVAFVRGKWNKKSYCQSSMLMSKSCHDLDLIAWMKSGIRPTKVASFGSNFQFRSQNAPPGAGDRCLVDCEIEPDCLYSARKHYLDHPDRWSFYVWDALEHLEKPTMEDKIALLKESPYGRCVWKSDMDVVDHQSVLIEFDDGCTATLNMIGGTAKPSRSLHLVGTLGEIEGRMEDSKFVVRHLDPRPGHEFSDEVLDLNISGDMTGAHGGHGGGDMRLVEDFINLLNGDQPSISSTSLEDSISGHLIGFSADRSVVEGRVVNINLDDYTHS